MSSVFTLFRSHLQVTSPDICRNYCATIPLYGNVTVVHNTGIFLENVMNGNECIGMIILTDGAAMNTTCWLVCKSSRII